MTKLIQTTRTPSLGEAVSAKWSVSGYKNPKHWGNLARSMRGYRR